MIYKGKVSINRVTGGRNGCYVSISLDDELSGTECVDIQISLEAFGKAVTGASFQDCVFEWRPREVGKQYEHKEIEVICDYNPSNPKTLLHPHEIDGWVGRETDLHNHHMRTKNGYRVNFHRWVEPTTKKPEEPQ